MLPVDTLKGATFKIARSAGPTTLYITVFDAVSVAESVTFTVKACCPREVSIGLPEATVPTHPGGVVGTVKYGPVAKFGSLFVTLESTAEHVKFAATLAPN